MNRRRRRRRYRWQTPPWLAALIAPNRRRRRYHWQTPPWLAGLIAPVRRRRSQRGRSQPLYYRYVQLGLAAVAVVALVMAGSVILRSIRTARLNESLVVMHTLTGEEMEAEIAAPPLERQTTRTAAPAGSGSSSLGELTAMGMPDGTPIQVPDAVEVTCFHRTDLDILPDMLELSRTNPDTVGWISIGGVVRLPVVYRDNVYYLDHDFTGAKNASGTLFLDEAHPLTETTQNLLIHGHSMNDGSMFGILTHYRKAEYVKEHPLIAFSTLWEKDTYAVFAVLLVSSRTGDPDYFNYFSHPTFASDSEFNAYVEQLQARSLREIPVDVRPTDALLTLSTCIDDDRLVIVARRMRPGESKDELISAVEASY